MLRELCKTKPSCKVGAYTSSKSITFMATSLFVSLSSLQARACVSQVSCYCVQSTSKQCDAPSVYVTKGSPANALQALIAVRIYARHCLPLALSRARSGHPLSVAEVHPPWVLSRACGVRLQAAPAGHRDSRPDRPEQASIHLWHRTKPRVKPALPMCGT